jgi:hypothetical protein
MDLKKSKQTKVVRVSIANSITLLKDGPIFGQIAQMGPSKYRKALKMYKT